MSKKRNNKTKKINSKLMQKKKRNGDGEEPSIKPNQLSNLKINNKEWYVVGRIYMQQPLNPLLFEHVIIDITNVIDFILSSSDKIVIPPILPITKQDFINFLITMKDPNTIFRRNNSQFHLFLPLNPRNVSTLDWTDGYFFSLTFLKDTFDSVYHVSSHFSYKNDINALISFFSFETDISMDNFKLVDE